MKDFLPSLTITLFLLLSSCSSTPSIRLDKHSASPELLECRMMFGESISELEELSSCLLQTDVIDTSSEQAPIKVAVIMIRRKNHFLHLVNISSNNGEIEQSYKGEGYSLKVSYHEHGTYGRVPTYKGKIMISDSISNAEYKVEGAYCDL